MQVKATQRARQQGINMIDRLKELFYEITGKDPLGTNRFIGTWDAVRQREGSEKCVFVLDDTKWTVYYDGQRMKSPPGSYIRTSRTSADIYYSQDFYHSGYRFHIATFLLRDNNNTLVWDWGSDVEMEFSRVR